MISGTYTGTHLDMTGYPLKDQHALLQPHMDDFVLAQFDDIDTGLGYGWYSYPLSDWDVDPEVDWS